MRIGLVVEWLDATRGGAETSTGQFIQCLLDRDVALTVFTRSDLPDRSGMEVRRLRPKGRSRKAATVSFIEQAESAIASTDCDLIHAFVPCVGADIYEPRGGTVAETILRTITVRQGTLDRTIKAISLRLNARQRWMLEKERSWLMGDAGPVVIALSDYVCRQLREHYQLPGARIRRIFNGVSVTPPTSDIARQWRVRIREELGIPMDGVFSLQVCHNFKLKGVRPHLEAVAKLCRSGISIHMVVVGGEKLASWRRLAETLGVSALVHFPGSQEDVAPYFHAADLLVHPSFYDPCSRVVLEAVQYGLPVIGSAYDGSMELFGDLRGEFAVSDPSDSHTLAAKIGDFLRTTSSDSDKVREMLRGLARTATMDRHADELLLLYHTLLTGVRQDGSP